MLKGEKYENNNGAGTYMKDNGLFFFLILIKGYLFMHRTRDTEFGKSEKKNYQ